MTLVFASEMSAVDPAFGWQAVLFIVAMLSAVASVTHIVFARRSQKREVTITDDFATKAEVKRLDEKVETLRNESRRDLAELKTEIVRNGDVRRVAIEAKVEAARQEGREAAADLREKVDEATNQIAEMRGETKMISQAIARLEMKGRS